jgi:hypothetical protein
MGGGWFDAMGGGWFDAMGGGWVDAAAAGGSQTFAMRADRPLVADDTPTVPNPKFPVHYWDSDLFALTFLPQFLTTTVNGKTWNQAITVANPPGVIPSGGTGGGPNDDKIDELRILAVTERPEAMGEIMNQNQNQQLCFLHLMMMTHNSHPSTYFVTKLAARVGEVVMMSLKRRFNRPRPTQFCPTLYPPVPVPGHASYPAGHAVIANLTAHVLMEVTADPITHKSPYEQPLLKLAEEIGRNRVIAGLHFKSDIEAGAEVGRLTHQFLKGMPAANPAPPPPDFDWASAVAAAKNEWK